MEQHDTAIARAGRMTVYELFRSRAQMNPDAIAIDAPDRSWMMRRVDGRVT